MQIIKKPERLTEKISGRITKAESDILKALSKKHKMSVNLIIRTAIQSLHEQDKVTK